jgi:hypothetical protein
MANKPQFQTSGGRAEYERARNALRTSLADASADAVFDAYLALDAMLDSGVARVKSHLLGSVLCWTAEDRTLSAWIYDQHYEIGDIARRAADLFERRLGADDTRTIRLVAHAFHHWGEASKWVVGRRERYDYAWMHWLIRLAMNACRQLEQCEVLLDGRKRPASVEALFFRTLILDRFAGGNLTRQQIEVLDAWLWEWVNDLKSVEHWPGEAALRADLDGKVGLRLGRRADDGPSTYLPLAPLEARRRAVIREFHRGRIVPAKGVAAGFRVEEHVAVLEQLKLLHEAAKEEHDDRIERHAAHGTAVEVWVGLGEILSRAFRRDPAADAKLAARGKPHGDSDKRVRHVQFRDEYDASRRLLRLVNMSAAGFGFDATEEDAFGIAVGDLVGMRVSDDDPVVIGRVVRRVPGLIEGSIIIGVRAISAMPEPLTMSRTQATGRSDDDQTFIFVPGEDASGAKDGFLVPEKILQEQCAFAAVVDDNAYTIQFNRVRGKGRGWALAGYEILEAKRAEALDFTGEAGTAAETPAPAKTEAGAYVPKFELVAKQDDGYTDVWDRELSSRLL